MIRIPPEVLAEASRLFWDVDLTAVDPVKHADFVFGRVLTHGSWIAIRALRAEVGDDALRDFVRRAPHRLDRRSLRFFRLALVPEESSCTTQPFRRTSDRLFSP
jgi:hypothetical protein